MNDSIRDIIARAVDGMIRQINGTRPRLSFYESEFTKRAPVLHYSDRYENCYLGPKPATDGPLSASYLTPQQILDRIKYNSTYYGRLYHQMQHECGPTAYASADFDALFREVWNERISRDREILTEMREKITAQISALSEGCGKLLEFQRYLEEAQKERERLTQTVAEIDQALHEIPPPPTPAPLPKTEARPRQPRHQRSPATAHRKREQKP
jgi:hypothetical protein